jgi:hypothetical protein
MVVAKSIGRRKNMRRVLVTVICFVVLSVAAIPVSAQTRYRRCDSRSYSGRNYSRTTAYDNRVYRESGYRNSGYYDSRSSDRYGYYDDRSRWQRSRNKITTAIGAGAGAAVGGLIGGKKGAIIGAIAGGGGAALYTYKIRNSRRNY